MGVRAATKQIASRTVSQIFVAWIPHAPKYGITKDHLSPIVPGIRFKEPAHIPPMINTIPAVVAIIGFIFNRYIFNPTSKPAKSTVAVGMM